jgi:hypothetical protein
MRMRMCRGFMYMVFCLVVETAKLCISISNHPLYGFDFSCPKKLKSFARQYARTLLHTTTLARCPMFNSS